MWALGLAPLFTKNLSQMKFNLFITSVLVVMLSMVVSKIVYFGFTPNYGADIFARKAFDAKFDHGGNQYRVLSKYLVYGVDGLFGEEYEGKRGGKRGCGLLPAWGVGAIL